MVRTHESLITNWTLKVLLSCVRPVKFIIYVYQKSIWEIEILYKISCPQWANVSNFRIGMTLDFVKRQKSIHRILCQSPVPLSRGSLSEKIILSHCKVWILSLMAFPHRSGFVVTWYFPQTCHRTQTHKHTHKHTREKIPHTKKRVWRPCYTDITQKTSFVGCWQQPTNTTKKHRLWSLNMTGQTQTQFYGHLIWRASSSLRANFLGQLLQLQGKGRSPGTKMTLISKSSVSKQQKWHWWSSSASPSSLLFVFVYYLWIGSQFKQ